MDNTGINGEHRVSIYIHKGILGQREPLAKPLIYQITRGYHPRCAVVSEVPLAGEESLNSLKRVLFNST